MQILTTIRKFLFSRLWSEIFLYVYTVLPGATATRECFKLASSDAKKLSKKLESHATLCATMVLHCEAF